MVELPDGEKLLRICRPITNTTCDRQTDRQRRTSCDGIVRAMHTRHAVKITDISLSKSMTFPGFQTTNNDDFEFKSNASVKIVLNFMKYTR